MAWSSAIARPPPFFGVFDRATARALSLREPLKSGTYGDMYSAAGMSSGSSPLSFRLLSFELSLGRDWVSSGSLTVGRLSKMSISSGNSCVSSTRLLLYQNRQDGADTGIPTNPKRLVFVRGTPV